MLYALQNGGRGLVTSCGQTLLIRDNIYILLKRIFGKNTQIYEF